MSKENSIKLRAGDSALIVRHEEQGGFTIEIYHHMDKNILTQDDIAFYAMLTRGMAYHVTSDLESVLDYGKKSFDETVKQEIKVH
jgi:hypothetical protein